MKDRTGKCENKHDASPPFIGGVLYFTYKFVVVLLSCKSDEKGWGLIL